MPLFSDNELQQMYSDHAPKREPPPKSKREIVLACVEEFSDAPIADLIPELAAGAERTERWVKKVLRESGIPLPARQKKAGRV